MHLSRTGFFPSLRLALLGAIVGLLGLTLSAQSALAARSASIVIDANTGAILHAANPDTRSYPASLTKVMTLFLLFDELESGRLHLNSKLAVSAHAAAQAPSKLGLEPGDHISVHDAILALVTKSANDVAVVVGEAIGGNEPSFAQAMTRKAQALGMHNTTYRNASGLPNPGQMSTVRDQATLARAMISRHAGYYKYFATREFVYEGQTILSHNRLMLRYPGADGMKTGYIHASGFNLISSAKRGDTRIIGVVFGGTTGASRDKYMAQLLDKGFAKIHQGGAVEMAKAETEADSEADAEAGTSNEDLPNIDDLVAAAQAAKAPAKAEKPAAAKAKTVAAKPAPKKLAMRAAAREDEDAVGDADPSAWAIQVGAFNGYRPAHKAAADAAKKLGRLAAEASIDIDKAGNKKKPVYRARISGLSEGQARAACKKLGRTGTSCKLVNPDA